MKKEGKEQIWKEYQKEIPDNNFFYVRSCVRQNFFPAAEVIILKILREDLGRNVYETPHHTTCGGVGYHSDVVPLETAMTIHARQFALMTQAGLENYLCSCITSFGFYSEVIETWHHFPQILDKVRKNLKEATGREFNIPKSLIHVSDLVYKLRFEIAEKAKYKLINRYTGKPLKVVEHIGCHYAKMFPHKGFGGAEYPCVLVGMVEAWGGEVVDYPERRHCCGFGFRQYLIQANRGYSLANSAKKFQSMEPFEPDMIITNCPGCPYFLDRWQYVIAETEGKCYGGNNQGIPVFTYEEVAGMIMGYDPWDIGLQMHQVAVEPLLDKIGIPYHPETKYMGANGEDIGKPEMPTHIHCC